MFLRFIRLPGFIAILLLGLFVLQASAADNAIKISYTNDLLGYLEPCG